MDEVKIAPIKQIRVSECIPYDNNMWEHSPEEIEKLKRDMQEGQYDSYIGVDKNNVIVFGHKRRAALMEINPSAMIPVFDLTLRSEKEIEKRRIKDNTRRNGILDEEKLQIELQKIYGDISDKIDYINDEMSIDISGIVAEAQKSIDGDKPRSSSEKTHQVIIGFESSDYTKYKIFSRSSLDKRPNINSISDLLLYFLEKDNPVE